MWSQFVLCALVALAAASSSNPGWKDNTEYVYQIRGRTLASLHEVADEYSGILLKAKLIVRPTAEGKLMAKIDNAEYAQVHSHLSEGWNTYIPDSQLSYKQLPTTDKPFQIVMEKGVVRDLIVDQDVPEWEANIIKSIVSQMQLDTKGENRIHSQINTFPTEQSNNGVYKTLEDTVTGITETLYEIKPLPEYVLQSKPWLAPFPHLKGDGHIIEIVKNKNFSNSEERPTYYFGLSGMGKEEPATNQLGQILTRTSMGHAIITGNLNRYTIQHSMTVNKIVVSPTLNNQQKGSVMSVLNITLANAQPQSSQFEELAKPVSLGSLVYSYSKQSGDNKVKSGRHFRAEEYNTEDSREQRFNSPSQGRFRRHSNEQFSSDVSSEEQWQQEQPKLNEAPEIPMLRFSTGFQGKSIKHQEEGKARKAVQKLANEIAQELEHFEQVPKKSTLAKFVLISSLTRIMNEQELQEIASELYTKEQHGVKRAAWVAFRDAVAESGTGPALLTIKQWIESQKVQHEEAAQIFESMVSSVRQPTEEYIKTLYHLIKSNEVLNQQHLNETALLSFSDLVRKVYVDEQVSHNEYPVHTFGNFRTESGVTFVRQEYIPFLAGHLRKSIEQADNRKIHVYIRALGNVAHEDILSVFEPYLEGKKQVSQFQRLLMVVALDEFSKVEPKLARAVLYKIYQNIGETQEVRSAAVFQLMRTSPPTDMLQRMAEYTHQDPSQHVRSAVKSVIESASQLEGYEFQYLRKSAESARPLLTKKDYGVQYPKDYLRSYVAQEMKVVYKQTVQSLVGEESALPNALKYSLRAKIGGLNRYLVNAQAMVSSIDELVNVLYRQTESYKHQQQQQEQQEQSEKSQWSSKYVAQLLNMHVEEREQLEGNLYLHLGNLHRILSFDNRSIELAPEMIREVEQMLQGEKSFRYTKLANNGELVISFPTEMGFPFMYTYDMPALVRIEGKVVATAKPQLVSGDKIRMPEQIDAQTELKVFVSARMQTKLGFITPFDHQEYAAGYDKNVQFQIPIRSKVNIDLKQKEVRAEIEALEPERNTPLVHYSSWPYTATYDILSMEPIANRPTTKIISKKTQHKMDHVFGQQSTGVAFRVRYSTEQRFVDVAALVEKLRQRDPITALMTPWLEESIQRAEFDIEYQGEQSTTRKLKIKLSGEHEYQSEPREESNESIEDLAKLPKESEARKQEMLKKSSAGIRDVKSFVYDAEIKFEGEQPSEYVATTAVSKSDVDRKSRILFYLNKKSEGSEQKPFHMALSIKSWVPNTNGLNMQEAIEMDSSVKSEIKMAFGQQMESATKVHANLNIKKTDARKQYLSELPMYHQCRREMEQGNYQLPACANMTQMANILDRVQMEIKYENVHQQTRDVAHKLLNGLRALGYFNLKEDWTKGHGKENHIDFEAQFSPDLRGLDISFETKAQKVQWDNIRVNDWMQRVIAVHPVFHVRARLAGKMLGLTTFRPICVVDKTAANTFDNKTYPLELTNIWTVMLQYVPRHARQHQQEHLAEKTQKYQQDKYVVLVRQSKSEQKEVKIILAVPETKGQTVEITLKPAEGQSTPTNTRVFVDEQQVQIHEDRVYKIHQGLVQIYGLPKGEVKVEVRRGFYVIFDGKRVKLTVTENKFRNSVRGLCGTFDGESNTDFTTPKDCVLRDPREFMATYSLIAPGHENQEIMDLKSRAQKNHCVYRKVPLYVELISQRDQTEDHHNKYKRCSIHQTRYVKEDGQICFTLRPLIACTQECQQRGTISKNVEVHCVQKSNVAELWMNQIQKGASPDFSLKSATKTIKMELPQTCSL